MTVLINNNALESPRVTSNIAVLNEMSESNKRDDTKLKPVVFPLVDVPLVLLVTCIECNDVKDVELIGKNDLYVKVSYFIIHSLIN